MAQLLARHLDGDVKAKLQRRATVMAAALKRKSARSSATRSGKRVKPEHRSDHGSRPASPVWVSRRMFPSCAVNRPAQLTLKRDRASPSVASALMRREPNPVVVAWLDGLPPESIWTTSITAFEVRRAWRSSQRTGADINWKRPSRRRSQKNFESRVLPFDQAAAQAAGRIAAERRRAGCTVRDSRRPDCRYRQHAQGNPRDPQHSSLRGMRPGARRPLGGVTHQGCIHHRFGSGTIYLHRSAIDVD
jgi:predicted nucleic acid-binding protein